MRRREISEDFWEIGFFRGLELEGRGNERVLEFRVEVGKSSPIVAIESKFMSSNDYFIKFHMSRL